MAFTAPPAIPPNTNETATVVTSILGGYRTMLILLCIAAGFVLGCLFTAWAKSDSPKPETTRPIPSPPDEPIWKQREASEDVAEDFRPTAAAIAEQLYLVGIEDGSGHKVRPIARDAVLDRGSERLVWGTRTISAVVAQAYMLGVWQLRHLLGVHSGIDDGALDEAVTVALARKVRDDAMRKELATDGTHVDSADPDSAHP
jgi:hypothetical protein